MDAPLSLVESISNVYMFEVSNLYTIQSKYVEYFHLTLNINPLSSNATIQSLHIKPFIEINILKSNRFLYIGIEFKSFMWIHLFVDLTCISCKR